MRINSRFIFWPETIGEAPYSMLKTSWVEWRASSDRVLQTGSRLGCLMRTGLGHLYSLGMLGIHSVPAAFCLPLCDSMGSALCYKTQATCKHESYSWEDDILAPSIHECTYICTRSCSHLRHSSERMSSSASSSTAPCHIRKGVAFGDSPANCERRRRHPWHGWYHCRDTKLSWSGTCRNPYLLASSYEADPRLTLLLNEQRHTCLRTHIGRGGSGSFDKTWPCTFRGDKIPLLDCAHGSSSHQMGSPTSSRRQNKDRSR